MPSTIIRKLEVQGFKSFVDRTRIIFHPGITAIIGPNGTGKSNIVDALLWVTGGLRLKSLRGDRTEDIIFNGNAKRPPLSMADAVLTLGSEEEELILSHRVFRSGESEYKLNGKSVRLKDIQDELWKRSIGEKEYFVIEQGAIGNFVTSKPAEKRALLEEAAGTAYYKDKKRQAQSKLETSEQNLIRLEDIIAEVEKAKNSLQRQAQAAARYRRLRERIRELTSAHFERRLRVLEQAQRDAAARFGSSLEHERDAGSKVKFWERELAAKRKELWDLERSLKENQEKLYALKAQIARAESEIDRESRRIEFFEEKQKKADSDRAELKAETSLLDREAEEASRVLEEQTKVLESRTLEVERIASELQQAKDEGASWETEAARLRGLHLERLGIITEKKNEVLKLEKEIELLARQEEKLAGQVRSQQAVLDQNRSRLEAFQKELAACTAEHEEKRQAEEGYGMRLAGAERSFRNLEDSLAVLTRKQEEERHHLQALRKIEEKERMETVPTEIPGSLGFLADLVATRPEDTPLFDIFWKDEAKSSVIPAETFLNHSAEKPVRGDFFLLPASGRENVPAGILGKPGVVGLLKSRLLEAERLQGCLAHLRDAVIVRDFGSAVRLWLEYPAQNFITESGDLLLSTGLLRLGKRAEGMIALNQEIRSIQEKISALVKESSPLEARLREEKDTMKAMSEERETLTSALIHLERQIQDYNKEIKFVRSEKEKSETTADILARELELLRSEKSGLLTKLEALTLGLAAVEQEAHGIKAGIEADEKERSARREREGEKERRFFELKSGRDLIGEKITNLRHQLHGLARRKETAGAKMTALETEAGTCREEQSRIQSGNEELTRKIKALEAERVERDSGLASMEMSLFKSQKELEQLERKVQEYRDEEEAVKEDRIKWEVSKAEVERDLVNLEETCWQELKKTLAELKADAEARVQAPAAAAQQEGIEPEGREAADEEPEEDNGGAQAEPLQPESEESPEKPRERRTPKKHRPVVEMADEEVEKELEEARDGLQRYKAVNLMAEEEFMEQKQRYEFLVQQRRDLRESIDSTQEAISKIDEESKIQFLKAVGEVNRNFQEVFNLLFKGGNAEVKLLEPENPLESGVEIVAQPPGKRVQNLALLSGGEKSLTSLAFMFALFRYKPSPFCFLDEVDAALDDVNLARFLDLMMAIKSQTQFIIITHNYKTMEVADYIYGTTMEEPNITKLLSMKIEKKENFKVLS